MMNLKNGGDGRQDFLLIRPRKGMINREEIWEIADNLLLNFILFGYLNLAPNNVGYSIITHVLKGGQVKKSGVAISFLQPIDSRSLFPEKALP